MSSEPLVGRLFVALFVPPGVAAALARIRPAPGPGVRPVADRDLHLTLHFLGKTEIAPAIGALSSVRASPFELGIADLGCFELRGGRRILWVGVEANAGLSRLHAKVASRLASIGFEPEDRPYRPHLTLARLGREARADVVTKFLGASLDAGLRFDCLDFRLCESRTDPAGARYRVLETFPLAPPEG